MATTTPKRLKISGSGSAMMPRDCSMAFTTPSFCSTTTQAVVRTSKDVQKGSSTKINSMLAVLSFRWASR